MSAIAPATQLGWTVSHSDMGHKVIVFDLQDPHTFNLVLESDNVLDIVSYSTRADACKAAALRLRSLADRIENGDP